MLPSAWEAETALFHVTVALAADPLAQEASCLEGRDPTACVDGGLAFVYGDGVPADAARGADLLTQGCDLGEEQACFHATLLSAPEGSLTVEVSLEGIAELKARCSQGKSQACYQLGVFHDRGPMSYRDMSQATMLFRQACEADVLAACFEQASDYASGGTEPGLQKATALFEAGCTSGHGPSCRELGKLLKGGSPERAAELSRQACELGDQKSCPH